jgi:hypothetical protein
MQVAADHVVASGDLMPSLCEIVCEVAAQESGDTGDENLHVHIPLFGGSFTGRFPREEEPLSCLNQAVWARRPNWRAIAETTASTGISSMQ